MRRRAFIAGLGSAAAWPIAGRGQTRLPTIGMLGADTPVSWREWTAAFVQRLKELSWIEGRTVRIEYRWAEGQEDRYAEIAAELIRSRVDVIVTQGTPSVLAAKQATSVIPIVFASAGDPVGNGLVSSLARPGGNVTGLSAQMTDTVGKRLAILREVAPKFDTLAIMANLGNPFVALEVGEVQVAVRALGLSVVTLDMRHEASISAAFDPLRDGAGAIYVATDPFLITNRARIVALAQEAKLPAIYGFRIFASEGGLISYGANIPGQFRRAADFVDKILRGAKPADMPVEQPTRFDLVVNMKTARALGLSIPETLLATADEVIQ
jgi:putative tryptophan/tyrosine transport system substrate-binding protein